VNNDDHDEGSVKSAAEELMLLHDHLFSRMFDLIVQEFIGSERFQGILSEVLEYYPVEPQGPSSRNPDPTPVERKLDPGC